MVIRVLKGACISRRRKAKLQLGSLGKDVNNELCTPSMLQDVYILHEISLKPYTGGRSIFALLTLDTFSSL
jgi:hypothetical protein